MERPESQGWHIPQTFTRPRALILAAGTGLAGLLIGAGVADGVQERNNQPPPAIVRIISPQDQDIVRYRDTIQVSSSGNAQGWEIVVAVQGIYDQVRDSHIHPQSEPKPAEYKWAVPATFGYSGNLKRDVDFDIMAYLTHGNASRVFARYAQTGQLNDIPNFPGFLSSQLPLGAIEEQRIRVKRLALTDPEIQQLALQNIDKS